MDHKNAFKNLALIPILTATSHAVTLASGTPDPNDPRLAGWWDANDPASQDALQSGFWPDRSSNGREAFVVNGSSPFLTTTPNGNSAVEFGFSTGYFEFDPIFLLSDPTSTATVFLVSGPTFESPTSFGFPISSGSSPGFVLMGSTLQPGETLFRVNGLTVFSADPVFFFDQNIRQVTLSNEIPGAVAEFQINGETLEPVVAGGSGSPPPPASTLGGSPFGTWSGTISEVLIFQEALTPEESAQITSYLAEKYQIAVIPEPTTPALALLFVAATALTRRRKITTMP